MGRTEHLQNPCKRFKKTDIDKYKIQLIKNSILSLEKSIDAENKFKNYQKSNPNLAKIFPDNEFHGKNEMIQLDKT